VFPLFFQSIKSSRFLNDTRGALWVDCLLWGVVRLLLKLGLYLRFRPAHSTPLHPLSITTTVPDVQRADVQSVPFLLLPVTLDLTQQMFKNTHFWGAEKYLLYKSHHTSALHLVATGELVITTKNGHSVYSRLNLKYKGRLDSLTVIFCCLQLMKRVMNASDLKCVVAFFELTYSLCQHVDI